MTPQPPRTPWFTSAFSGPGLHALVIGTSDYRFLPAPGQLPERGRTTLGLSKLDIAATGAFRFASWLTSGNYWHPSVNVKSVRLLLAPSALELQRVAGLNNAVQDPLVLRPETDIVAQELQAWQDECRGDTEGIAVLYAAGHGIQWGSRDDALVLLEDFSKDRNFINQTLDIGQTFKGMNDVDLPQTQFYFADACAVEPEEYSQYVWAGHGVSLPEKRGLTDLRAAPLYFAACPGTEALGKPGSGTYFALSLIDCLNGEEPFGAPFADPQTEAEKYYRVSVSSLVDNLQNRIRRYSKAQQVTTGGSVRAGVFSAAKDNLVTVTLNVNPDEIAAKTIADLLAFDETPAQLLFSDPNLKRPVNCIPKPVTIGQVKAGSYMVRLSTENRTATRTIIAVPPRFVTPIVLG